MSRKTKTPTLQNKNGPITLTQRGKGPITFQGFISFPSFKGKVEVRITASVPGWQSLRYRAFLGKEFADAFSNDVIDPIYHDKIRDKPAKDEWDDDQHRRMKLLTALLFLYFSHCGKQRDDDAIINTIKTMARLYSDKKVSGTFLLSSRAKDYNKRVIKKFKTGYLYDGNDILSTMSPHKRKNEVTDIGEWTLHLLHVEYGGRINKLKASTKNENLIRVYSILSAAMVRFFRDLTPDSIESQYLDKQCFVDFGVVFNEKILTPPNNRTSA